MAKIDGLEIVMTKQMQKMIDKELKKRFEELKPELAKRYEELLNMRNMEADQFNDGFNDARAGKLETDQPHYDLDTDNWRLGYAWGMFEPMKEKLARERQVSDAEINELGAQEAERKEFCPNCEAETPCTHEAELFVCDICGEDFAKYIVSRYCNVSDVSMTQDILTDVKTPRSIENTNPDYYKDELYLDEDFRMLSKTYPADVSAIGVTTLIDYVEALEAELARRDEELKITDGLLKEATETVGAVIACCTYNSNDDAKIGIYGIDQKAFTRIDQFITHYNDAISAGKVSVDVKTSTDNNKRSKWKAYVPGWGAPAVNKRYLVKLINDWITIATYYLRVGGGYWKNDNGQELTDDVVEFWKGLEE